MMVADSLNFNKVQYLEQSTYFLYQSSGQGFNFDSSGKWKQEIMEETKRLQACDTLLVFLWQYHGTYLSGN